jgi:hypothetical protein
MAEFLVVVDTDSGSSRDYADLNTAEGALQCNLTTSTETKVFGITGSVGTMVDGESLTGVTSGATGTLVHKTSTQALIKTIGGTPFSNGENVKKTSDAGIYFTLTDAGQRPQVSIECRATTGVSDTSNPDFNGWTASNTYYIKIWTAAGHRHAGKWTTGKYTLARTITADGQTILTIQEAGVIVQGIQFDLINGVTKYDSCACIYNIPGYDAYGAKIEQCIFRQSGTPGNYSDHGAIALTYTRAAKIGNNIIYDFKALVLKGYGILLSAGGYTNYIYCNTFVGCQDTIRSDATSKLDAIDNIITDPGNITFQVSTSSGGNAWDGAAQYAAFGTTQKTGTTTGSATNKLIDSGGGLGAIYLNSACKDSGSGYAKVTAIDSATQLSIDADIYSSAEAYSIYTNLVGEPTFVDKAGKDFTLSGADTIAQTKGVNLYADSNYPITVDILGNARPSSGAFDIGAFEVAAFSGAYPNLQERGQEIGQQNGSNL